MKLTNRLNLPDALVRAVSNDPYSKGASDVSVTELTGPLRAAILKQIHRDEITEDVADRLWSTYGQLIHHLLERSNIDKGVITERRLDMTIDGVILSGAMDSYEETDGILTDWKFVTSYKFKGQEVPEEWEIQQNLYAELLRANGHKITSLRIIGLLRDHSKLEAKRDPAYPQFPIVVRKVPMWPVEKVQAFLKGRIAEFKRAKEALPECTPVERWAKPHVYAVTKIGAKRSSANFADKAEAEGFAKTKGSDYSVIERPGENTRCEHYCSVAPFCEQFKKLKGGE